MSKCKINSLLVIFLVLSLTGFAQNSKTLSQQEKTPKKEAVTGKTSGEKEAGNDSARNAAKMKPSKNAEVISTGKTHHIINKKELRNPRPGQADPSAFIYDLNAFYALGQ